MFQDLAQQPLDLYGPGSPWTSKAHWPWEVFQPWDLWRPGEVGVLLELLDIHLLLLTTQALGLGCSVAVLQILGADIFKKVVHLNLSVRTKTTISRDPSKIETWNFNTRQMNARTKYHLICPSNFFLNAFEHGIMMPRIIALRQGWLFFRDSYFLPTPLFYFLPQFYKDNCD